MGLLVLLMLLHSVFPTLLHSAFPMLPLSSDMHPLPFLTQFLLPMLLPSSVTPLLQLPTLLLLLTQLLLVMRLRSPTPTSTELLMTTPTPTSTLLRLPMLLEMCRDPTLLLSL